MSQLDDEASATLKNMIQYGSGVSLFPLRISSIVTFAFKTAVIVDCTVPDRAHPFFSYAERKRFAATLKIPRGVQVWLSSFRSEQVHGRYSSSYAKFDTGAFKGFEFYAFT